MDIFYKIDGERAINVFRALCCVTTILLYLKLITVDMIIKLVNGIATGYNMKLHYFDTQVNFTRPVDTSSIYARSRHALYGHKLCKSL